jgi:prevent-host-death family protein
MTSIGYHEAQTRLSQLLDEVGKGKKVLITRRGRPAALLVPPPPEAEPDVQRVVREMLEFRDREGPTLGVKRGARELIEEGRRF